MDFTVWCENPSISTRYTDWPSNRLPTSLVALGFAPGLATPAGAWGLLSLSGVITAVPLLFFGAAVRRLQLSTMGFLQYVGPTLQFTVAMVLFRKPLDRAKLSSFVLCWLAIGLYVMDTLLYRQPPPVADEPE